MPAFRLACLAYVSSALPGSILGLLWPGVRTDLHQPVAALGVLIVLAVGVSVAASAATGRLLARVRAGALLAIGVALTGIALVAESLAPSVVVFGAGMLLFGAGFGSVDAALNAYAARHFGARRINGMHAAYGLGATAGPALATLLLAHALSWRWIYGLMGVAQLMVAAVFALTARVWLGLPAGRPARTGRSRVVAGSLAFTAVEAGIEGAAGIWGYLFLTEGRGLPPEFAGLVVSAYWAMMFVGRVVFGAVAERSGPRRVLAVAVLGVSVGAAMMTGPGAVAAAGLIVLGLAAAPVFPLFTLTTADRGGTAETVGLQVAASAVGSAALPAGIGLAIGAFGAGLLAMPLLLLSLAMCGVYATLARR